MSINYKKLHKEVYYYYGFEYSDKVLEGLNKIENWKERFPMVYQGFLDEKLGNNIKKYFLNFINSAVDHFAQEENLEIEKRNIEVLPVDKQVTGHFINTHTDTQGRQFEKEYTMLIYVNDEYKGGEISFAVRPDLVDYDNGQQAPLDIDSQKGPEEQKNIDFWIKPEKCSVVIMKSDTEIFHTAHIVTEGTKYLIKTWIGGHKIRA